MSIEFVLLRTLMDAPSHGYRLQKAITSLRDAYPVANVNVYPLLHELEREGHVSSSTELAKSRARKVYEITPAGRSAFEAWLSEPPEVPLPATRDPVRLKLLLATHDSAPFDWLPGAVEATQAERTRLEGQLRAQWDDMPPVARLAAQEQVDALDKRREFLLEALRLVESRPTVEAPEGAKSSSGAAQS